MTERGSTLIEMMIVAAMLGISVGIFATSVSDVHDHASHVQNRERALQLLEYEADAITRRAPTDPRVHARLLSRVPGGSYAATQRGAATELTVTWQSGEATYSESLYVIQ